VKKSKVFPFNAHDGRWFYHSTGSGLLKRILSVKASICSRLAELGAAGWQSVEAWQSSARRKTSDA
jgi:hypothetical protein